MYASPSPSGTNAMEAGGEVQSPTRRCPSSLQEAIAQTAVEKDVNGQVQRRNAGCDGCERKQRLRLALRLVQRVVTPPLARVAP